MVLVMQAVGVGVVGAGHTQGLGLPVHKVDKGFYTSGYVFSDHIAALVGGGNHDAVQKLPQTDLLALHQAGGAAVNAEVFKRRGGDRQGVVQIPVFQSQHTGHDLGQAGRVEAQVQFLAVDDGVAVKLDESRSFDADVEVLCGETVFDQLRRQLEACGKLKIVRTALCVRR